MTIYSVAHGFQIPNTVRYLKALYNAVHSHFESSNQEVFKTTDSFSLFSKNTDKIIVQNRICTCISETKYKSHTLDNELQKFGFS